MPPADPAAPGRLSSEAYILAIRQEPQKAKVVGNKEKASDRKPVDPPPIVQLRIRDPSDPAQNYLQSPYYFMCCNLWDPTEDRQATIPQTDGQSITAPLAGNVASCLHRLKDADNTDGGFFVFGDVSVRLEGRFRLRFVLFELMQGSVVCHASIISHPFQVYSTKAFPGMNESTFLSRSFGDQGVRLRIRKEARAQKRPSSRGQGGDSSQSQGYAPQRPGVSAAGSIAYSTSTPYSSNTAREYQSDFAEPPGKRQRSAGPGDRSMYSRPPGADPWAPYSQAQSAVNPYATHQQSYAQDGTAPPQSSSLAYRNSAQDPALTHPGYQYSTPQHPVAYDQSRSYGQQESPAGQYSDRLAQTPAALGLNRHGHPADQIPYPEISYGQVPAAANPQYSYGSAMDQRRSYGSATSSGPTTLPPLGSTATTQAGIPSNSAYNMGPTADGRYSSQQSQSGYSGYQSGMPVKEEY